MASSGSALCCDSWRVRCPPLLQGERPGRVKVVDEEGLSSRGGVRPWRSVLCPALLHLRVRSEAGEERESSRGGERLWRCELSSSSWSDKSFFSRSEEEDEEEEQEEGKEHGPMSRKHINYGKRDVRVMEVVASFVEKLLIADFFFILFILAWFVAGLAEKAAFDTSGLIDVWLLLWPRLFQPAIGSFMAGSLWTVLSKIWRKR